MRVICVFGLSGFCERRVYTVQYTQLIYVLECVFTSEWEKNWVRCDVFALKSKIENVNARHSSCLSQIICVRACALMSLYIPLNVSRISIRVLWLVCFEIWCTVALLFFTPCCRRRRRRHHTAIILTFSNRLLVNGIARNDFQVFVLKQHLNHVDLSFT